MRRTVLPLLSVLALLLVAAGGVAAGDAGTTIGTADETDTDGTDAGICLVGADSPCTDAPTNDTTGDRIAGDGSDGQVWIPEDRNHDGDIDERFRSDAGDDAGADAGICLVGADSPCTDASENDTDDSTRVGDGGDGSDGQVWIPEDRNHDGDIDERFRPDSLGAALVALAGPLFGF